MSSISINEQHLSTNSGKEGKSLGVLRRSDPVQNFKHKMEMNEVDCITSLHVDNALYTSMWEQRCEQRGTPHFLERALSKPDKSGCEIFQRKVVPFAGYSRAWVPYVRQLRSALTSSWLNLLLPFIPAGFVVNYMRCSPITITSVNFMAMLPCAALIAFSLKEVASRLGDTYGGLLSMTLR